MADRSPNYRLTVNGGIDVIPRTSQLAFVAGAAIEHMGRGDVMHVRRMDEPHVVVTMGFVNGTEQLARDQDLLNFITGDARNLQLYCTDQATSCEMTGWGHELARLVSRLVDA